MPPLPAAAIHTPLPSGSTRELVQTYHSRTKHRRTGFAQGPQTLDWEAQPAPFRHFTGAPRTPLPLLHELPAEGALRRALGATFAFPVAPPPEPVAWDPGTLGALLQLALGITAHKSLGPDRWALRANPSSGNLHPVEAYVLACGLPFLPDGIYHYAPDLHALEQLGEGPAEPGAPRGLFLALSSVQWRETWKYGERAFRYCQLDVGHALSALGVAAAALGAALRPVPGIESDALAELLQLPQGAPSEREEAELLLQVTHPALPGGPPEAAAAALGTWRGGLSSTPAWGPIMASRIDPRPLYRWPIIELVAAATRSHGLTTASSGDSEHIDSQAPAALAALAAQPPVAVTTTRTPGAPPLADVVLQRRSAQRFDIRYTLPEPAFARLLAVMRAAVRPEVAVAVPRARLDVVLFVHRVDGLSPGIYLLPCGDDDTAALREGLRTRMGGEPVGGACGASGLVLLGQVAPRALMRHARLIHCQQDIASSSCFALGILAPLADAVQRDPAEYRALHREAGQLLHAVYLQAEAEGLRATGIGCFLDDEVHSLLSLESEGPFQTLYHGTVGRPLVDARIETVPAYPERTAP